LEEDGGAYQPGEQLEGVGIEPTQEEMTGDNPSEEEAEQQLSVDTAEMESPAEWPSGATKEENNKGDLVDPPTDKKKELQSRRLHKKSHPLEKLDMMIEEIRKMMLRSAQEAVSIGNLSRGEPGRAVGKKQQQQRRGARGQLLKRI
jgi:hypothetical protein